MSAAQRSVPALAERHGASSVVIALEPEAKKYPRWVRLSIMIAGGLLSWAVVIAAGWALYRAVA